MYKKLESLSLLVVTLAIFTLAPAVAHSAPISIELTSEALGIGTGDINSGSTVDPDVVGKLITSPTTGEASILTIQTDGKAGPGTALDPLLVTITAREHLDTLSGLPDPNDYQAGVIFLSKKSATLKDNGLGVRAFTVDGSTGLRLIQGSFFITLDHKAGGKKSSGGGNGFAMIEGSKDVSGGTGPDTFSSSSPNGAPHVDEDVLFDFNPLLDVKADSVEMILTKFDPTDIFDLHVELDTGAFFDFTSLGTGHASLTEVSDMVWKLKLADLGVLAPTDKIDFLTIRAIEDNPDFPKGTAEHFLINGLLVDATTPSVPEPATIVLVGLGALGLARKASRKAKRRQS